MKKSTLPLLLIFLALLVSCKKNKVEPIIDVVNFKQKYLKSVAQPNNGYPITETFQYDTLNRILQQELKSTLGVALYDYRYIAPSLIEKKDKQNGSVDSLFLDDRGLVVKELRYYKNGITSGKYIYEYDTEKRLTKRTFFLSSTGVYKQTGTFECSYTGSKLMKTTEISTNLVNNEEHEFTHVVTYEYASDVKNTFSYKDKGMVFNGLESAFLPTKTVTEHIDKRLLTNAILQQHVTNEIFDYKLDKDGCVSQVFIKTSNTFNLKATYEYF